MTLDRSKIPLTRVAIADLIPLQRGLRSKTVEQKRALIRAGDPIDAPLLFRANGALYVADGHHSVEAAFLEGFAHIKARIIELGKFVLNKALMPTDEVVPDPFRSKLARLERRLARQFAEMLSELGEKVANAVGEVWVDPTEVAKAIPPDRERDLWRQLDEWINEGLVWIESSLEGAILNAVNSSGEFVISELIPEAYDDIVDQVFDRAKNYAKRRAGELIGKNARGTGELAETTRKRIRSAITKGIEDNVGRKQIEAMLMDDFGFSDARASLIAGTEIAQANSVGSHLGLQEAQAAGVQVEHAWIAEEDACEICLYNAGQGFIPADEPFASGHLHPVAHPNCRCAEASRVVEPVVKSHLSSVLGTRQGVSHSHPETGNGGSKHDEAA